jgi:hypothetical protein
MRGPASQALMQSFKAKNDRGCVKTLHALSTALSR